MPDPKDEYEDLFLRKFEVLRKADPMVHRDALKKYNELAARTRKDNPEALFAKGAERETAEGLEGDDLGRTFVRLPDAPPLEKVPKAYPTIPLPFGAKAEPFKRVYPGEAPKTLVVRRPGTGPDVAEHERLHVRAVDPRDTGGRLGKRFEELSPRERVLWRVLKTMENEQDPHAIHRAHGPEATSVALSSEVLRRGLQRMGGS